MIESPPLRKAYFLIKKNQIRRKMGIYKKALSVVIDVTIAIYLLLIGGYVFASIFIIGDFINDYYEYFVRIEKFARERYWLFVTILPLRYINLSFSRPGVSFTSAEY